MNCLVSTKIWYTVFILFQIVEDWEHSTLLAGFKHWFQSQQAFGTLPFFIIWDLWHCRNLIIFENKPFEIRYIVMGIVSHFSETCPMEQIKKSRKVILQNIWNDYLVGFFDGACKFGLCGCGVLITFDGRVVQVPTTEPKSSHYGGCYSLLVGSTSTICIFSGILKDASIG